MYSKSDVSYFFACICNRGDAGGDTGAAVARGGCGSAPVAAATASTTAGPTSFNPLLQLTAAPPRGGNDIDEAAACCAGGRGAGGDTEGVGGDAGPGGGTAPAGGGGGVAAPSHRPFGGCSAEPRAVGGRTRRATRGRATSTHGPTSPSALPSLPNPS